MNILPFPQKFVKIVGTFTINADTKVFCDEELKTEVERFLKMIENCSHISVSYAEDIADANMIFKFNDSCVAEGYHIMISQGTLTVSCVSLVGCFYAVETLKQILDLDTERKLVVCNNCYVEDSPKFAYRGLMVDVCRHFFTIDTLKQVIDLMSQVKLNKLHLHFSDDQGFRLQIDKYPLLNTISSVRQGSETLINGQRYVDELSHGGFYTKDEIREIVCYARQHYIEIIPEIDLPGHIVAALAAYPQYSCIGAPLEVRKKWGISKDILCAGNDDSYVFIKDILDEVCQLFPSAFVHLGGDEAPKDRWCNCKLCREKMSQLKLSDFNELQTYMVEQFRAYLEEKGKTVICWNDGITESTSDSIISQAWKPFTHRKSVQRVNSGRQTIMSPFFKLYFDYPYAMIPLQKTRNFKPLKGVKRNSQQNVLGVEGALWTEYIACEEKLFFNLLPRLDALAECAWGSNSKNFSKRVAARYSVYDKLGLCYNSNAIKSHYSARGTTRFFKYDANEEFNKGKSNK